MMLLHNLTQTVDQEVGGSIHPAVPVKSITFLARQNPK
jgi:hypothetical protein